jgi:hypothetical protein
MVQFAGSVSTVNAIAPAAAANLSTGRRLKAALQSVMRAIVAGREAQAKRIVHRQLTRYNDAFLLKAGYSAKQILEIRTHATSVTHSMY